MAGVLCVDVVVEPANLDKSDDVSFKAELRSCSQKWEFVFSNRKAKKLYISLYRQFPEVPLLRESNEPLLSTRRRYDFSDQEVKTSEKEMSRHLADMKRQWKIERADDFEVWLNQLICTYCQGQSILIQKNVRTFLQIPDELYPEIDSLFPPREEPIVKLLLKDNVKVRVKGRSKERATIERIMKLFSDGSLRLYTMDSKQRMTGVMKLIDPKENVTSGNHKHNFCIESGRREWTIAPSKSSVEKWISKLSDIKFDFNISAGIPQDPKEMVEYILNQSSKLDELYKIIESCLETERKMDEDFERKRSNLDSQRKEISNQFKARKGVLQVNIDRLVKERENLQDQIESALSEEGNAFALLALKSGAMDGDSPHWQNWLRIGSLSSDKKYLKKPFPNEFYSMALEMQKKYHSLSSKKKLNNIYCHYHITKNLHKHLHHHVGGRCRTYHHSYSHTWILTERPREAWGYKDPNKDPKESLLQNISIGSLNIFSSNLTTEALIIN